MNPAIDDWRGKRVWLLGASTGIGAAAAPMAKKAPVAVAPMSMAAIAVRMIMVPPGRARALAGRWDLR